jgi:phage terminase Nu1 subunit (DNA packaging protein)
MRRTNAAGQAFKENTWAISVNKHGGRFATFHQLAVAEQIVIENPLLGRSARARVVRVCGKRRAADPYEVCVELAEAQNVWGVKQPPDDWEKDRQVVAGERGSSTLQGAPPAQESHAGAPEKGGKAETAHLAPAGSPGEVGERHEGLIQSKEKIGEAEALRQELSALRDALQSARTEVENLLLKAHETRRDWTLEVERVAKESLFKAVEECLPRLAGQSASMLEKFRAEAQAVAAQLQSQVETTAREFSEGARREILENLEGAVEGALESVARDFNKLAEDALELLKEGLQSAQQQCVEETQKQLEVARQLTLNSLESEVRAKSASLCEQPHTALVEMLWHQTIEMETGI